MKGKLVVIDGGDGAGKATQVKMLVERLLKEGHEVETLDFPRYQENFTGKLLRQCLDGQRGNFMDIDAHIASVLYAVDRYETKPKIFDWIKSGKIVILDRYVSSNMIHQGAKISNHKELELFLDWLDNLEHGVFKLPRPDIILYLEVPAEMRAKLKNQAVLEGKHKAGLDLSEVDFEHQKATEERAQTIVAKRNEWCKVVCTDNLGMKSKEDIHEEIFNKIEEKLTKM